MKEDNYLKCGFKLDKIIQADYWYIKPETNGVIHKKTLIKQAQSMKKLEEEYAVEQKCIKVNGIEQKILKYSKNNL